MKWNGRKVLTAEEWDYSEAKIGDLVEQELVDDMLDLLPVCGQTARRWERRIPTARTRTLENGGRRSIHSKKSAANGQMGFSSIAGNASAARM